MSDKDKDKSSAGNNGKPKPGVNGKPHPGSASLNGNGKPVPPEDFSFEYTPPKKPKQDQKKSSTRKKIEKITKPAEILKAIKPFKSLDNTGFHDLAEQFQETVIELGKEHVLFTEDLQSGKIVDRNEHWYREICRALPVYLGHLRHITLLALANSALPKVEVEYDEDNKLKKTKVTQQNLNPAYVSAVRDILQMEFEVAQELRPKQSAAGREAIPAHGDPVKHGLMNLIKDRFAELKEKFQGMAAERAQAGSQQT